MKHQRPHSINIAKAIANCKNISLEQLKEESVRMKQTDNGIKTWAAIVSETLTKTSKYEPKTKIDF